MTTVANILLETKRLYIFPLSYDQLVQYLQANNVLEESLGLSFYPRTLPAELVEAFEQTILPAVANPANDYVYSTLWTMMLKEKQVMVGDLCFKGAPNEAGEIEIGYGTYEDFQGAGYMTEAIAALTAWAFEQPGVTTILAETEASNIPLHKTLQKNNFTPYMQKENMQWWRLEKS
jgi:RimJ/RimL family protein N-acetyltransferase